IGKDKWCVTWRLHRPDGTALPHDQCPMAIALREKRPVRNQEAVVERPDGTKLAVLPYPTPLFDDTGAMTGAVNMLVDISERSRTEHAAHQLAAIVESSDDAIVSKDLSATITSWNKGAERIFGYSAQEAIGRPVTMLIPEDHQDEEPRILERIRRGERIAHYETKRQRKDGSLIDISLTVSPMKNSQGVIIGASKIARDITERKRSEQALARRAEEQAALYQFTDRLYRAESAPDIYDAALDAIVRALRCDRASVLMFDRQGVMRFVAWRGLSDTYRQAVEGHSPWDPKMGDPRPLWIDNVESSDLPEPLKDTLRAEGIGALAFIPLVVNGRLIGKFMTYYQAPHIFRNDEADLAVTVARQLGFGLGRMRSDDAWHAAVDALSRNQERLQLALEAGHMGAWEWDFDTGRVVWSPGLEAIHGLEPGTFGGTFDDFARDIHPDDLDKVLRRVQEAVASRSDYHIAYRMRRPDGAERWLEAFGRFVPGTDGESAKLAGVCMDITERRQAEEQRDLLVAELSHRVKNTLSTVISIAHQSFARAPSVEDAKGSFESRIRALAQTHGRLAEAHWSGVSLETIALDELAPYRHEDGGNVRIAGPRVMLSPRVALTLGMALHELATNAAKYGALSTRSGAVDLTWSADARTGTLRIEWVESGGPAVIPPKRSGFGRLLLERVLASDVKGNVQLDFAEGGLRCAIDVPFDGRNVEAA
ncbi:MAG: PAS domain S-box protein, partial [Pseudorhodoplanes sp.]|nr:PAS domain S-box protein [Pseudorhodoplanes sp.]